MTIVPDKMSRVTSLAPLPAPSQKDRAFLMPVVTRPVNTASIVSTITIDTLTGTVHRLFEEAVLFADTDLNRAAAQRIQQSMREVSQDLEPHQVAEFYHRIRREFKITAQTVVHLGTPGAATEEFKTTLELVWEHPVYHPETLDAVFGKVSSTKS